MFWDLYLIVHGEVLHLIRIYFRIIWLLHHHTKHILQEGITIITMNVIHQYSYARIARTNFECNPYSHHYVEAAAMVHAKYFEQKQIVLLQKPI